MSTAYTGTEVAHLCPDHERAWFIQNRMDAWNTDHSLDSSNIVNDMSNAVLLRSDLHTAFDERRFVFFPKSQGSGFVAHVLVATPDIGQLFHNVPLQPITQCNPRFIYARFAWAIFPFLAGFLSRANTTRRLMYVKTIDRKIQWHVEDVVGMEKWQVKAAASRSRSPKKRQRAAEVNDLEDTDYVDTAEVSPPKRKRRRQLGDRIRPWGSTSASDTDRDSNHQKDSARNSSPDTSSGSQKLETARGVSYPSPKSDELLEDDPNRDAVELQEDMAEQRAFIPNFYNLPEHQQPPLWYPGWRRVARLKKRWLTKARPTDYEPPRDLSEYNDIRRIPNGPELWARWGVEILEEDDEDDLTKSGGSWNGQLP